MIYRSVALYAAYFAQFLKARLAYRADFAASLLSNLVGGAAGVLFVFFLMDGKTITNLRGWSREEILLIYGFSTIAMALFSFVSFNLFRFGDRYIVQGNFDRVLLRPLNSLCQVLFETFNIESLGTLAVGLAVVSYAGRRLGIAFTAMDYLWLLLGSLSGALILLAVFIFVASLSFHFEDRLGVSAPVYNLINFSRYPLPIFHPVIQFILQWIIPFAFSAFYPAAYFLKRPELLPYCYAVPAVAVVSLAIAGTAWSFGVRRYCSTGS